MKFLDKCNAECTNTNESTKFLASHTPANPSRFDKLVKSLESVKNVVELDSYKVMDSGNRDPVPNESLQTVRKFVDPAIEDSDSENIDPVSHEITTIAQIHAPPYESPESPVIPKLATTISPSSVTHNESYSEIVIDHSSVSHNPLASQDECLFEIQHEELELPIVYASPLREQSNTTEQVITIDDNIVRPNQPAAQVFKEPNFFVIQPKQITQKKSFVIEPSELPKQPANNQKEIPKSNQFNIPHEKQQLPFVININHLTKRYLIDLHIDCYKKTFEQTMNLLPDSDKLKLCHELSQKCLTYLK